jgi:hypothetical protein
LRALPFGARNAVFVLGATARALEYILVYLFLVLTAQYVDDFPQLESEELADADEDIMVEVLRLLGWEIKLPNGERPKFEPTTYQPPSAGMQASGASRGSPERRPVVVSTRLGTSSRPTMNRPPVSRCRVRSTGGTTRGAT